MDLWVPFSRISLHSEGQDDYFTCSCVSVLLTGPGLAWSARGCVGLVGLSHSMLFICEVGRTGTNGGPGLQTQPVHPFWVLQGEGDAKLLPGSGLSVGTSSWQQQLTRRAWSKEFLWEMQVHAGFRTGTSSSQSCERRFHRDQRSWQCFYRNMPEGRCCLTGGH